MTIVAATGRGVPSGSDTQIQYNDSGVFGADTNLTWNKTTQLHTISGREIIKFTNSNGSPGASVNAFTIENPSGVISHSTFSFNNVYKLTTTVSASGGATLRLGGASAAYGINTGSAIESTSERVYIDSQGIKITGGSFASGKVTAGDSDLSAPSTFNVYGSHAAKGLFVNSAYTLADETFIYVDPATSAGCSGTPSTECSSYGSEGACTSHSAAGCEWNPGSDCSTFSNTDISTCESNSPCDWVQESCSSATDLASCEALDDSYGGSCAWSSYNCSTFPDEGSCNAQSPCSWTSGDCSTFNTQQSSCTGMGGCTWESAACAATADQYSCEAQDDAYGGSCSWNGGYSCGSAFYDEMSCNNQPGCAWDSISSTCSGTYGTCTGDYYTGNCTGSFSSCVGDYGNCSGDYYTGTCSGTYGASCSGTALCSNLSTESPCNSEGGCQWIQTLVLTLPAASDVNAAQTSRWYSIIHVGESGTVTITPSGTDTMFQHGSTLVLPKKGDRTLIHQHDIFGNCEDLVTQESCVGAGCSWSNPCDAYTSSGETYCNEQSGCTWNGGTATCEGNQVCNSGSYYLSRSWYTHNLERGKNYVEKSSNYTLTMIDDTVNFTATSTATLPSAITCKGKQFTIKNTATGTTVITINTTSSQTIDGLASGVITLSSTESITVESTANNWIVV
jgi:hypothetical protein